jgi:hypothetical protein
MFERGWFFHSLSADPRVKCDHKQCRSARAIPERVSRLLRKG